MLPLADPPKLNSGLSNPVYNFTMFDSHDTTARGLRERILEGETTFGCWLTLGSSITAELVGAAGYDWALIDLEHGAGTESEALGQIQALGATRAAPLVRVESSARQRAGRVLDLGAEGVMFPRIERADEARQAASALQYPPQGNRGVAAGTRATRFGSDFDRYREWAAKGIVGIVQVETEPILSCLEEVASVAGVDVLFVGPRDLSAALDVLGQLDHPRFLEALAAVLAACRKHGKSAGILFAEPSELPAYHEMGFRFLACGSDGGFVTGKARGTVAALRDSLQKATSS
jgi:4-hydroxy-2-oxoheptanedioate aldolase